MTREAFQSVYDQGAEATFALFQRMEQMIHTLEQTVATLTARVQELEDQLRKDSHNSHKPPSSDGFTKKPVSLREKSGQKPGGQPGHPGTTLCLSASPDSVIPHSPATCSHCGACLASVPESGYEPRQVVDLPPLTLQVTEHQAQTKRCPTGQTLNTAAFPEGVTQSVQYGPKIKPYGP